MANHYAVPQRRKRVFILCTRKDLGVMPADIFPFPITPNPDRQISAYETIFDLEQVDCSETARYDSDYRSNILQYFKDDISIEEYVRKSTDDRSNLSMGMGANFDSEEPKLLNPLKKKKCNTKDQACSQKQLSLFNSI